jgi:hypothetical protein
MTGNRYEFRSHWSVRASPDSAYFVLAAQGEERGCVHPAVEVVDRPRGSNENTTGLLDRYLRW